MSKAAFTEVVERFLQSESPQVLAINGKWGIGKTYTWGKCLENASSKGKINNENYSYVSLFGINSIREVKYSMSANLIPAEKIGKTITFEYIKSHTWKLLKERLQKTTALFNSSELDGFSHVLEGISVWSLQGAVICIDDFERRGENLVVRDVLGFANYLKEHRNCKVVIILNEGEIDKEDFGKLREKVIDVDITFDPSIDECVAAVELSSVINHDLFYQCAYQLGITNIRILRKVNELMMSITPYINDATEEVRDQALSSLMLFAWSHYSHQTSDFIPPLTFVISDLRDPFTYAVSDELTEKEKTWQRNLESYGYFVTDELDNLLAYYVEKGFFIEKDLIDAIEKNNNKSFERETSKKYRAEIKDLLLDFNADDTTHIQKIYKILTDDILYFGIGQIDYVAGIFRDFGYSQLIPPLLKKFIDANKDSPEFPVAIFDNRTSLVDTEVRDSLLSILNQPPPSLQPMEILLRIAAGGRPQVWDMPVIATLTVNDWKDIFLQLKGEELQTVLRYSGSLTVADSNNQFVDRKVREALGLIATENPKNKIKVDRLSF